MAAAINIFINGIVGVFIGIAMLYLAIRLTSLIAGREPAKEE